MAKAIAIETHLMRQDAATPMSLALDQKTEKIDSLRSLKGRLAARIAHPRQDSAAPGR
jgi:hypothetical protein